MDKFITKNKTRNKTKDNTELLTYVKNDIINILEYNYLISYIEDKCIINSDWVNNILNKINNSNIDNINNDNVINISTKKNKQMLLKKLFNNDTIDFNDEQQQAIKLIFDYLSNINEYSFGLFGFAGTGKTTIITELMSFLIKEKKLKSIVFAASTNKAVNVLKNKFHNHIKQIYNSYFDTVMNDMTNDMTFDDILEKLTKCGVKIHFITIHKLLQFETDFNDDGNIYFTQSTNNSIISNYDVVIIDECSMLSIDVVSYLFNEGKKLTQTNNYKHIPKIIFIGDPAQLPPINETISSIFLKNKNNLTFEKYVKIYPSETSIYCSNTDNINKLRIKYESLISSVLNMNHVLLTTVERTEKKTISNSCYEFRKWTMNEIQSPNIKQYLGKNVIAYNYKKSNDRKKWLDTCIKYFKNRKDCIIITWTNQMTNEYNNIIRDTIFTDSKNVYENGDMLIFNDYYYCNDISVHTSEHIIVKNVQLMTQRLDIFKTPDYLNEHIEYKIYKNKCLSIIENINNTLKTYRCWNLTVQKLSDKTDTFDITIICDEEINKYKNDKEIIIEQIKSFKKYLIKNSRIKQNIINEYIIKSLWKQYHKNLIQPFANVSYGYAITCHKSQGSNFHNVFVDLNDILKNTKENEMKKCVYTAMTRTIDKLYLLVS